MLVRSSQPHSPTGLAAFGGAIDRRQFSLTALAALLLPGCGGGSDDDGDAPAPAEQGVRVSVQTTLHGSADDTGIAAWELAAAKGVLANLKELLYGQPMLDLIGAQVTESDNLLRQYVADSKGAFTGTQVVVKIKGLKLAEFMALLRDSLSPKGTAEETRDAALNIIGPMHPEHYAYDMNAFGGIETMGKLPTRSRPAYVEAAPAFVSQLMDTSYPLRNMGAATIADGTLFTYVLQQYKDTADGMEANLRIWYPAAAPSIYLEHHAKHYAVEFRNGARLAAAGKSISVSVDTTLHGSADDTGLDAWELAAAKGVLMNLKELLYGQPMFDLIGAQINESDRLLRQYVADSRGAFTGTQVIVNIKGLKLAEFLTVLQGALKPQSTPEGTRAAALQMFDAHPEHYASDPGTFGIVETMGTLPTRSHPAYVQTAPAFVTQLMDESYSLRNAGAATLADGTLFTYVLQQYKDTADGMEANLRIWYPAAAPSIYVEHHAKHYSVEFRNGARMAAAQAGK